MEVGSLGVLVIIGYLMWSGRMSREPALTFPFRLKDFKRFSLDWRFRKEDWITILLIVMAYPMVSAGSLFAGGLFAFGALVSHILIHLRRIGELFAIPQVDGVEAEDDLRGIYLSIIKRWHPDHAANGADFFRRNHITKLANMAFGNKDLARLRALNSLKMG